MADNERKYSSLYSAIHNIGRRPKRAPSRTLQESSAAQRQSVSTPNESYPIRDRESSAAGRASIQQKARFSTLSPIDSLEGSHGGSIPPLGEGSAAAPLPREESLSARRESQVPMRASISSPVSANRGSQRRSTPALNEHYPVSLSTTEVLPLRKENQILRQGQDVGEAHFPPLTDQAPFTVSPRLDANRGSSRDIKVPKRASEQQAKFSIPPSPLTANRGSEMLGAYEGQGPRESQGLMYGGEDTEAGPYARSSTEQVPFLVSPRLDPGRNSSNSLGGRESQLMNPEQVTLPPRMSSARNSRKGSSSNAESSGSPPRVTFSLRENSAAQNPRASLPDPNVIQDPPAGGYDITASKRLLSENAKKSIPMVDRHESFLKVPSVLEPEDEAILHDGQGLQVIDDVPPSSQMGAERSSRASSLLRIPPIVDNEFEPNANAKQGFRASSSFANPETYGPEVTGPRDEGEHLRPRSLQGAENMGLPQNIQSDLEGTDLQSSHTSEQVPRFSLQSARVASPSRNFSQAARSFSGSFPIGVEEDIDQGLKTSYMPLNPARASGSDFVHNAPDSESKQAVFLSNRFSQVSRPSFYPLSTDSNNEAMQAHRTSSVPLDIMQASLLQSFQDAPVMENTQAEQVVSPKQKFSQVSRPSSIPPPNEAIQGSGVSYMSADPMRSSLSEPFQHVPEMTSLPSLKISHNSRPSSFSALVDNGNENIQGPRVSYMPSNLMRTSLPDSFQYAPGFGSVQDQVESPKQKFSEISRPSSLPPFDKRNVASEGPRNSLYPVRTSLSESFQHSPEMDSIQEPVGRTSHDLSQVLPFDSENAVIQGPRKSYMALDPMQTPLPESSRYAPGRESMQEQVVSPDQKYSQVSRPSFFTPRFNIGNEANQGPRTSNMQSGFMRTSLAESSQGAPGIEILQEQVLSPSQKFSQDSWLSSITPGIDRENEAGQSRRATYVPADTMETSLPESYQNAPLWESVQEQVVSPPQKDSQALRESSFFPRVGSGYEVIEGPRTSYMPSDFTRTAFPESYENVLGMEGEEAASPSRTFSQVSRNSFVPSIGSMKQSPGASDILLHPIQASLREPFQYTPGMENMQEQVASPSQQFSQVFRPSAFSPSTGENNVNQAPKTSYISLNPPRASLPGSLQNASGMESEEQVAPPSRKSSQALQIASVPSLVGREEENNQGLRTSYRPSDSMRTSSPRSFQSAPALDSGRTSIPDFPIPGQQPQRPSSLSFSKQIQKRSSLGFPSEPEANFLANAGNSTSDSSSDEVVQERSLSLESVSRSSFSAKLNEQQSNSTSDSSSDVVVQERSLSLESVSRPSFSAKLNEQQSMVRPWDMERLSDAERRMREGTFDKINFETSLEDEPESFTKGIDQRPSDSVDGVEPYGSLEREDQDEERTRSSGFYATSPQDSDNMRSFSSGRKSLVQEFIYPTSSPRQSFQENISLSADLGESLHQEASYESTSSRQSTSPRQSISPRLSARQSLGGKSIKDLTELQTQEFMYSPSLARTTIELSSDGQDQAMLQSTIPEMADVEYAEQEFTLPSSRQSFQQVLLEEDNNQALLYEDPQVLFQEDNNQELPYEDPTYPEDSFVDEGDDQKEVQPSLQQQSSTLTVGASDESELNDEECFDDALTETQQDDAGNVLSEGKEDYIDDDMSPPTKDDLHSGSFANLEQPLGSFKRAFGSSNSFIKVPFGASELSYEGFAKVQFMEPTVGIWPIVWKSVAMQDLIRFSKDPITQPLLQRLAAAPHKQCAITSFAHLLAYMGDAETHQDLVYHIQQILMLGIKYSDFRDEIFCQICKQTTANPSRWSNGRGWQAMALCVGTFGPSSTFRPFLEAHLQQVANNFVGQWAGETMSYQDEGMSNPSKAAEYCIARLQKLLQAGSRRLPPLHAEINAVEKMETVRVNIYLPDDTCKVLDLDPMATAEEVTIQLVQVTGLSDPEYYGIFEVLYADVTVEKALTKNNYIMEVLSDWNKASIPPLEKDLRLIAKAKFLFEKHVLCLPSTNIGLYEEQYEEDDRFSVEMDPSKTEMLFKRRLFIEDLSNCPSEVQSAVQNFDYVQAVRDVAYGVYPVEEHDAVMLGSLQLRADSSFFENLEETLTDDIIRKFGPKIYVEGSEREWKSALLRTAAALPPEEDMSICINDYIDFLRSRCTLYGSCWFYVKQKADPRLPHEMFVAINTAGVYFVQVKTKEQLLHMQFTEICSWGYSNISFSLVTGNMTYNHDHRLLTAQGSEIGAILQKYINRLQY